MSPPSLATAGLIFVSKTSLILLIISFDWTGLESEFVSLKILANFKSLPTITSFPLE